MAHTAFDIGHPCSDTEDCTYPNIYCTYPKCTKGRREEQNQIVEQKTDMPPGPRIDPIKFVLPGIEPIPFEQPEVDHPIRCKPMVLKPCPFCGGQAEIERYGTTKQSTIIVCTDCGCKLESSETFDHGSFWNQRFDETDDE